MTENGADPAANEAEAALRSAFENVLKGDGIAFFEDLTSEAYVDLLHILPRLSNLPTPDDYAIEGYEALGSDHRFILRLHTTQSDITAVTTMRQVRGQWKLAAIKVAGIRE